MTPQQIKAIHAACRNMDDDIRRDLIRQYTKGRTRSSKEMTFEEARQLLTKLNEGNDKVKAMLEKERLSLMRQIYHLSMRISFLNKDYPSDNADDHEMNKAKVNSFCRGQRFKKNVGEMTIEELKETKKQFSTIVKKEEDASKQSK